MPLLTSLLHILNPLDDQSIHKTIQDLSDLGFTTDTQLLLHYNAGGHPSMQVDDEQVESIISTIVQVLSPKPITADEQLKRENHNRKTWSTGCQGPYFGWRYPIIGCH